MMGTAVILDMLLFACLLCVGFQGSPVHIQLGSII